MFKVKRFLKQHIIWIVILTVSASLLIILIVQYRSLIELGKALPMANRASMRMYLATLASRVEDYYRTSAEQTLSIAPDLFAAERYQSRMDGLGSYFEQHPAKVARRLFIAYSGQNQTHEVYSAVWFYDPAAASKFSRDPGTSQWRAAYAASSQYLYQSITRLHLEAPPVTVNEQDRENRVIARPIIGLDSTVLGVAGMILDETYFKEDVLPSLVRSSLQEFFPNDHQDMIITLQDESGNRLFETQPFEGKGSEVVIPLPFIFEDMNFKVVMRTNSVEQNAKRVVAVNFSLSVAMTGLLIAGILMALRTASREMKLSRMKSDFVSNVSHELRTPLASMRAFGELLRLGWVDEPQKSREYGEYIENESRRLTHLIDNILDFSKIESGRKAYEFRETDIKKIVDEMLKSFEVRFAQSELNVVLELPHEPLPPVVIDRDAVSQSLVNLIDNAIKYSGESKKILVRLGREQGYITISVTDYGIGIPREEQQRVFDKFYRIATGLVHDVAGSGLGLAIVKHIIDAHRGKITVKSQPGLGSTFTLYLPAAEAVSKNDLRTHAGRTGDVSLPSAARD
jgi:signal transduction histidine kinase